jgi:hypothetical protein
LLQCGRVFVQADAVGLEHRIANYTEPPMHVANCDATYKGETSERADLR